MIIVKNWNERELERRQRQHDSMQNNIQLALK